MSKLADSFDTIILGAGAAGLYCGAFAGAQRGRVLVVDHAKAPGEKIRISGGGRCNFTNLHTTPENFLSNNRHFCKSALKRHTQFDFLDLVERHGIAWHEKTLGQLFCDDSAKQIIAMLTRELDRANGTLWLQTSIEDVTQTPEGFRLRVTREGQAQTLTCRNLVVATGGKSIPKMGATGFGYRLAEQFGHELVETRPALVPLTFGEESLARMKPLAGISAPARISCDDAAFEEGMLFTHRGLSGPSILQISSYWREGEQISIHLLPETDILAHLKAARQANGRRGVGTALAELLPKRLADDIAAELSMPGNLADQSDKALEQVAARVTAWSVTPIGSEGYRTAEVTLGGVDTDGLDSRTMMSRAVPGLYFIGEVVDVTGWLGGYNFQWAWSSGWAAGTAIAAQR